MLTEIAAALLIGVATSVALPAPVPRAGVTTLTADQISSYRPYALLARAAYCPASKTATWSCGAACNDLPGFVPYASGGDGAVVPFWFVGYYPTLNSVVVSNQGTDPLKIIPLLTDGDTFLDGLDATLFPGVPSSVMTHNGFQEAQERSATTKLAAIKKAMVEKNTSLVTLTGHSLGGAISLIDALYLSINLPSATLKVVTHGMPRVGNPEFAALIDSKIKDLAHINNEKDIVPIVPGMFLGFAHPSGEKHIVSPGNWVDCSGQDSTDASCTIGTVPNVFLGDLDNHGKFSRNLIHLSRTLNYILLDGPYEGVSIGWCP
ncbi:hypothetical protein FRC07_004323 [Ceratobasidium sp. 392]|nr:hypothetical protein FRC07_004323 [Ceratobasidium sp. 392]